MTVNTSLILADIPNLGFFLFWIDLTKHLDCLKNGNPRAFLNLFLPFSFTMITNDYIKKDVPWKSTLTLNS